MVMDGYYVEDRLAELWTRINTLHLSYLEKEESPKKLELKNNLDDCIKDYLCIAPHGQKFCFKETAEVLHRSASCKKDFSGYRAALGWNAIGMYAGNLIAQPWRQEYRVIKMYSGYYKHQIEANLVGAEVMFEAMGYKHAGNGVMVLEGPICPDRVTNVSQDSLVAYVECQILKEIWEEVSTSFKITWLEALEFRESHLCSPKKSVDALRYQIQQRQYHEHQRSHSQGNGDYLPGNSRYPPPHLHLPPPNLPNHSFPPLSGHSHLPMSVAAPMLPPPPANCIYNGYYANGYGTYGAIPPPHYGYVPTYAPTVLKQPPYNGYYCNGYAPPAAPPYVYPVPTAQLIELDQHGSQLYDVPDGANKLRRSSVQTNKVAPKKDESPGQYDSWDYVYRDLESQGYTKDLGERGDVLNVQGQGGNDAKILKDFENLNVSDRLRMLEALEKYQQHDKDNKKVETDCGNSNGTLGSSYDNLSGKEINVKKPPPAVVAVTKTKMIDAELEPKAKFLSKTLDFKKLKAAPKNLVKAIEKPKAVEKLKEATNASEQPPPLRKSVPPTGKWQCGTCTYLNDSSKNICEICSKSKTVVSQQMEIGGSECSKCTLVNPKDKKVCEACGASLQNSPTYI